MYLVGLSDQIGLHKRDRLRLERMCLRTRGETKTGTFAGQLFLSLAGLLFARHTIVSGAGFAAIGIDDEKIGMRQTVWSNHGFVVPMSVDLGLRSLTSGSAESSIHRFAHGQGSVSTRCIAA